ncbi:MAG TPA: PAS domain-containing protein, partial [Ignavibacteriaceae bacterium]|nr:PAS domain-containing protein [Ignavibacteriaceae bacterium]
MDDNLKNKEELLNVISELRQRVKDLETQLEERPGDDRLILQKTQFQHLFEKIEFGVVLLDAQERVIHVNKKFEKIFQ